MEQLDGRGLEKSQVTEMVRQAVEAGERDLFVTVSDMEAVGALKELADQWEFGVALSGGPGGFLVVLSGEEEEEKEVTTDVDDKGSHVEPQGFAGNGGWTLLVGSDAMGTGDRALGRELLDAYFDALTRGGEAPGAILFFNEGVKAAAVDRRIGEALKTLAKGGCQVLVCETSLRYYGLSGCLPVGEACGMEDLAAEMSRWARTVTL